MKYIIFAIPFLLVGVLHGNPFVKKAEPKANKKKSIVAPRDRGEKPVAPPSLPAAKQHALDRLELPKLPEKYLAFDLHRKHIFAKTLEGCVECNVNKLHNDFEQAYWQLVDDVEEVKNAKTVLEIKVRLKKLTEKELNNAYMLASMKNMAEAKKAKDLISKIIVG